jgi:mRNA interferase RelE/StbE
LKEIKKLDRINRELIISYLEERLDGCANPRQYGEPLKGTLSGAWRYRVGQYRIICELQDNIVTVYVENVGHRRQVYKR